MKQLIFILFLFTSIISFSQNKSNEEKVDYAIEKINEFYYEENFDSGYYYFEKAKILFNEFKNDEKFVDLHFAFGPHYNTIGLYDKALELYMDVEGLISEVDENRKMLLFNRVSYVFSQKKNFNKSLEYIEKSILIAEKNNNKKELINFKSFKADVLQQMENYQEAIEIYKECLILINKDVDLRFYAQVLNNLGLVYQNIGDYKKAEKCFLEAYDISKDIKFDLFSTYIETELGDLYRLTKDYNKSKYYLKKSLEGGKNFNHAVLEQYNYKNSYLLYKEIGDYYNSLQYFEKYHTFTDSINKLNNDKNIIELETKFRTKEKEKEIEVLNKENELVILQSSKKNWIIVSSLFLIVLSIVVLTVIFKSRKNQIKANESLKIKNKEIEQQKEEITDSINYARIIQKSIFGNEDKIKDVYENSAVFHQPKDIVSGDFFWMHKNGDKFIFTVADCTGHGVPGAMVSMIGNNALNESVKFKGITKTDKILNHLSDYVYRAFSSNNETKNGMDIAVCCLDLKTKEIEYSGAFNSLYIFKKNGDVIEVKSDKKYIGQEGSTYKSTTTQLDEGDCVYIMSDGYCDQFGGEDDKKFKISRFKEMVKNNVDKSAEEQKQIIAEEFFSWKNGFEQVDDVCVAIIKI